MPREERILHAPQPEPPGTDAPTAAVAPPTGAMPAIGEAEGTMIGRYKILQRIGEGGFGVVYMAQQTEPVRRRVALKILKPGMDTKHVVARFEAERQALALMDHPNIACVLDGGATPTGRPFFVMELVRGEPLTQFCDRERLDARQRVELLRHVALAVQHAHAKGVIHRDLKPTNVLVDMTDGAPLPKVIDFGIAKATSIELTDRTVFTDFRQLIGTPEYMSPEQSGGGVDVDTRTDVYSLGVMLYELLTGTTPLDSKKLRSASYVELQRMIQEDDPPTPSQRLTGLTTLNDVAARRRAAPSTLRSSLRGELDWIVMKCLEKDRGRRYQTVAALVDDLDRYLGGRTVIAAPPSAGYRVRKFVTRYKAAVLGASLVLAVLVLGIIGTSVGLLRASREKARLARASDFLEQLVLAGGAGGAAMGSGDVEAMRAEATALFPGKPIGASVLLARADLLMQQSQPELAVPLLRRAVDELRELGNKALLAGTLARLGKALRLNHDPQGAEPILRQAVDLARAELGPASQQHADAVALLVEAQRELALLDTAWYAPARQTGMDAIEAFRAALGPENARTVRQRAAQVVWMARNGFHDEALSQFPIVYDLLQRTIGVRSAAGWDFMLTYVRFLAGVRNDTAAAAPLYADLIEAARAALGPLNSTTLELILEQATVLWRVGEAEKADAAFADFARAAASPEFRASADFPVSVAGALVRAGALFERQPQHAATALMRGYEAMFSMRATRPNDYLLWAQDTGRALLDVGRYAEAERVAREYLEVIPAPEGRPNMDRSRALTILGAARLRQGFVDEAETLLRQGLSATPRGMLLQPPLRHTPQEWLGEALATPTGRDPEAQKARFEEAKQRLRVAPTVWQMSGDHSPSDAVAVGQRLIDLYTALGDKEEVDQWRAWVREKAPGPAPAFPKFEPIAPVVPVAPARADEK